MFEQVFEFIGNHPILIGTFVVLLIAFLINEGKQGGASIGTGALVNLVNREGAIVVDVRDQKEYNQGHIVDAVNIPYASIEKRADELKAKKDSPIVIVCKMGQHSSAAGKKLKALGYENVRRLSGGMAEWTGASLPIVKSK